jgi:ABC-type amino acid transport/signal transduction systems, periplasmic component/domain
LDSKEFDSADYITKDIVTDDATNLKKLYKGRIDIAFIDKYVARYIMHRKHPHYIDELEFMYPAFIEKKMYICFTRKIEGMAKIAKDFNEGLKTLKVSGEMDEKYERSNDKQNDDVSDYYDYDSFLVESDIVDTRLVKDLMLYAMHLRELKIKNILHRETKEVAEEWFTDEELDRQIKEIAIVELDSK